MKFNHKEHFIMLSNAPLSPFYYFDYYEHQYFTSVLFHMFSFIKNALFGSYSWKSHRTFIESSAVTSAFWLDQYGCRFASIFRRCPPSMFWGQCYQCPALHSNVQNLMRLLTRDHSLKKYKFLFPNLRVFFTVKSPSVTQRSVSQENAFRTSKNPVFFLVFVFVLFSFFHKSIGLNNSFTLNEKKNPGYLRSLNWR